LLDWLKDYRKLHPTTIRKVLAELLRPLSLVFTGKEYRQNISCNYRDMICAAEDYRDPSFWRLENVLDNYHFGNLLLGLDVTFYIDEVLLGVLLFCFFF